MVEDPAEVLSEDDGNYGSTTGLERRDGSPGEEVGDGRSVRVAEISLGATVQRNGRPCFRLREKIASYTGNSAATYRAQRKRRHRSMPVNRPQARPSGKPRRFRSVPIGCLEALQRKLPLMRNALPSVPGVENIPDPICIPTTNDIPDVKPRCLTCAVYHIPSACHSQHLSILCCERSRSYLSIVLGRIARVA